MDNEASEIKSVNQRVIADRLQVSVATVSKALGGHTDISKDMRKRVEDMAKKLGYSHKSTRHRRVDPRRKKPQSALVGVMIRRPIDSALPDRPTYLGSISSCSPKVGASVIVHEISKNEDPYLFLDNRNLAPAIRDGQVAGVAMGGIWPAEIIDAFSKRHRVVLFPQKVAGCQVDVVSSDKLAAMRQMVESLKALGHERIGFFGRCGAMPMLSDLYAGYISAVSQLGLPFENDWIVDIDPEHMLAEGDEPWWMKRVDQVEAMKKRDGVEAWVCCNDWPGYQLYRGMADRGYSIPKDLSITGFDDNEPVNLGCPPLTSIKVPIKEICETVLLRIMHGSELAHSKPAEINLACDMVEHGTTGPPSYTRSQ